MRPVGRIAGLGSLDIITRHDINYIREENTGKSFPSVLAETDALSFHRDRRLRCLVSWIVDTRLHSTVSHGF